MALFIFYVSTLLPNLAGTNQQGYCCEKKGKRTLVQISLLLYNTNLRKRKKKEGECLNLIQWIDFTHVYKKNQTTQLCDSIPNSAITESYLEMLPDTIISMSLSLKFSISDTDDISDMCIYPVSKAFKHPWLLGQSWVFQYFYCW